MVQPLTTISSEFLTQFINVTAQNLFSPALSMRGPGVKRFTALIDSGTYSFTPVIQISRVGAGLWVDFPFNNFVASVNTGDLRSGEVSGDWDVRVGVKTSNYTSGDAICTIQRAF